MSSSVVEHQTLKREIFSSNPKCYCHFKTWPILFILLFLSNFRRTWGQDYKEKHKTRLKTNVKRTVLNNTKLRHFWAQIVSWAPIHARKTFIIMAPVLPFHSVFINLTPMGRSHLRRTLWKWPKSTKLIQILKRCQQESNLRRSDIQSCSLPLSYRIDTR